MSTFRQRLIDEVRFFAEELLKKTESKKMTSDELEDEYEVEADEIMNVHQWNEVEDLLPEPNQLNSEANMRMYLCECKIKSPFSSDAYTWYRVSGYTKGPGNFDNAEWTSTIARRDCIRWMEIEEYTVDKFYDDNGNEIDEDGNIIPQPEPEAVEPEEVVESTKPQKPQKTAEPSMQDIPDIPPFTDNN